MGREDGVDVLKTLRGEAQKREVQRDRQQAYQAKANASSGSAGGAAAAKAAPKAPRIYEPVHKYFVSSNWKNLLDRKPRISPKTAANMNTPSDEGGRSAFDVVAIDCEMVGVGPAMTSVLARVSIVDTEGNVLMDRFVKTREEVTDYRTHITGLTAERLGRKDVLPEDVAQKQAAEIVKGKIVVGHAVKNDFQVLELDHSLSLIRDTSSFKPLRIPGREKKTPSLKRLASYWLQESIQDGAHDSVQDAQVALRLYRLKSRIWEKQMRSAMTRFKAFGDEDLEDDDEEGEPVQRAALTPEAEARKAAFKKKQNEMSAKRKRKRTGRKAAAVKAEEASRVSTSKTEGGGAKKRKTG